MDGVNIGKGGSGGGGGGGHDGGRGSGGGDDGGGRGGEKLETRMAVSHVELNDTLPEDFVLFFGPVDLLEWIGRGAIRFSS